MNLQEYCLSFKDKILRRFPNTNLENPQTFTDKMQWLKIYDTTMLKAYCADKIHVRDYCEDKIGEQISIPILAVYDTPEQIEWDKLPQQFVLKCNHGSGMNIIVKDKNLLDKADACRKLRNWLNTKYGDGHLYELHYNLITPKILVEKYELLDGNSLGDYRFWCFNGEVKFFSINFGFGHGGFNFYDLEGNLLPYNNLNYPSDPNRKDKMPSSLKQMIEYSQKLCKDFKFVRVDFFEIDNEPKLAEMTFMHNGGDILWSNKETDIELGNMLKLD